MSSQNIHLYLTSEHDCGYLPDRTATNLVPDPRLDMDMALYSQLIGLGYRRSGQYTYRPHCRGCNACVPCRLPVAEFQSRRNQRRALQGNQDLDTRISIAHYSQEYFDLYARYLNARHADGDMVNPTPEDFRNFLYCDWSDTRFLEARLGDRLLSLLVFDRVADGLSAVYSFFDPEESQRSLGTYNVMQLIEQTRRQKLPYVYMGYTIEGCKKMEYKQSYRPMQFFRDNRWVTERAPG